MRRFFLPIWAILSLVFSCKSNSFFEVENTKTTEQVILGSVGSEKEFILQKGFNTSALPSYKQPIRLIVSPKDFDKQKFKMFEDAAAKQSASIAMTYIDSIAEKPKYVQIQIADKIAVIEALNGIDNEGIKDYLNHNTYAQVLTKMSVAFAAEDLERLIRAEAIFLKEKAPKMYVLELHDNEQKIETIWFNQGVIFEYQVSNCCWQENNRRKLNIVDLVGEYGSCPNSTFRSSKRAKKKINYYKL